MDLAIGNVRGRRWRVVLDIACIAVIAVALVADVADLVGYLRKPASYPIGSEAAGVRYASRVHFMATTAGAIALYIAGLVAPAFTSDRRRKTAIRVAVALWAVISTVWFVLAPG
jgi:hypothetical protein